MEATYRLSSHPALGWKCPSSERLPRRSLLQQAYPRSRRDTSIAIFVVSKSPNESESQRQT